MNISDAAISNGTEFTFTYTIWISLFANRILFGNQSLFFFASQQLPELNVYLSQVNVTISIDEINNHTVIRKVIDQILLKNWWTCM